MVPAPEPPSYGILATNLAGVMLLICCYVFGVWLRSYVFPPTGRAPLRKQLLAAIPIGLVTMGIYGKTTLPSALTSAEAGDVFDFMAMLGYAIVFGMLSRESLERMLASGGKSPDADPPVAKGSRRPPKAARSPVRAS